MVSLGHVYSDTLYYTTSLIDYYLKGIDHCRPEPFYYWSYYVGLNFIWIVVPLGELPNADFQVLTDVVGSPPLPGCIAQFESFRGLGPDQQVNAGKWRSHPTQRQAGSWQLKSHSQAR